MNFNNPNIYQPFQPMQPYQPGQYAQQRLAALENQYPQFSQNMQQPQMPYQCIPVTSIEEVRGFMVDFTGRPVFFHDVSHSAIYEKRFDTGTGNSIINEYKLEAKPEPLAAQPPAFVTHEELEAFKQQILGGASNVQRGSNSKNDDATEPATAAHDTAGTTDAKQWTNPTSNPKQP